MILEVLAVFFATIALSLLFNIPKTELIYCGFTGAFSWFLYLVFYHITGSNVAGTFVAACGATILARALARRRRVPITIFLVGGIIPLVPGGGIYDTMYSMINGQLADSFAIGVNTFKIAGSIGLGIIVALSLPDTWFEIFKKEKATDM